MRRAEIVAAARQWCGTPYRHQAATLGAGCDCLGLLRGVWQSLYGGAPMAVPAYRADWRDRRHAPALLSAAEQLLVATAEERDGQVLLFRVGSSDLPRHCGILSDGGRLIHAQERLGVVEVPLSDGWRQRIAHRFDFPGVED